MNRMSLPPSQDPYANIAEFYDLEHDDFEDDIDLYRNLASVVGDPVLELGCGTGRVLAPLAAAGHRVTGVDASRPMLDRAEARLESIDQRDRVQLQHTSFEQLGVVPGSPFGLAIVALNGLMHVTSFEAQRDMLCTLRSLLDPRGMLVIDLLHATPAALQALDQTVTHDGSWELEDGSHLSKMANRRILPADQRIDTELWYDRTATNGVIHRTISAYSMRWLHRSELELMLELGGYAEWHVYGSYELDPLTGDSDRLIVTAEVEPS